MMQLRMVPALINLYFGFAYGFSDRERLITDLFQHYVKEAQPQEPSHAPTNVSIGLGLTKLVDHLDYELVIDCWNLLMWKDNRLLWNASEYDGIEYIIIPSSKVWIPDVILYNGDFVRKGIIHNEPTVGISNVGDIVFYALGRMTVNCQHSTEATQFSCTLVFGSSANDNTALRMRGQGKQVDTEILSPSSRLAFVASDISNWWKKFKCCPNKYDLVKIRLSLRDIDHYRGEYRQYKRYNNLRYRSRRYH